MMIIIHNETGVSIICIFIASETQEQTDAGYSQSNSSCHLFAEGWMAAKLAIISVVEFVSGLRVMVCRRGVMS